MRRRSNYADKTLETVLNGIDTELGISTNELSVYKRCNMQLDKLLEVKPGIAYGLENQRIAVISAIETKNNNFNVMVKMNEVAYTLKLIKCGIV